MKKYIPKNDWEITVDHVKKEAIRTIESIRNGCVDLDDLDKLQNHLMFSVALMKMQGPKKWELAKIHAKIMSMEIKKQKTEETKIQKGEAMNGNDIEDLIRDSGAYEAIYDDSEGRKIVVITGSDLTYLIQNLLKKEKEKTIEKLQNITTENSSQ